MHKQYRIHLTAEERETLTGIARTGTDRAYRIRRAQMLLLADRGTTDAQIAAQVEVHPRTVSRLREQAVSQGVMAALKHAPRQGATPLLDSIGEAALVAIAC